MSASVKPWPWHGDGPAARARKVALAYRAIAVQLLAAAEKAGADMDPDAIRKADERFMKWGEGWLDVGPVTYDGDDMVGSRVAGSLVGLAAGTISRYRVEGRIVGVLDEANRCFKYKVDDVYALKAKLRGRGHNLNNVRAKDNVAANGTGAPQ
jgi:hypothetical protein